MRLFQTDIDILTTIAEAGSYRTDSSFIGIRVATALQRLMNLRLIQLSTHITDHYHDLISVYTRA